MGQIDDQDLLLTTLTSLGFDQAGEYVPDIDVINSIRVLIRFLMHASLWTEIISGPFKLVD